MPDKKKQPRKTAAAAPPGTETGNLPPLDFSGQNEGTEAGNEPWRKWTVKPDLKPMSSNPDEAGIGERIAYCRGQLDNLSVEALARYTKKFDPVGVSKASLVRYEGGDSVPGARELRILCKALWVPANWLLFGTLDSDTQRQTGRVLLEALESHIKTLVPGELSLLEPLLRQQEKYAVEERQRWIDEARKPPLKM